jgi:ATP phosphoribosyltransferase regulatory subunit
MNTLLHTPEGVRDIYNGDCAKKLYIEDKLHTTIRSFGYSDIEAPSFEFFDIFNKERGSVASKEMYKFFDREGNTLVLRPDMTPQIARIAAKYFGRQEAPIKLCYRGRKFVNGSSYQGRLKETTDIGAELIGDASIDSDAEVIVMVVESLLACGLKDFQVEIGHIDYFKGLSKEAGLSDEAEAELLEMINNKNYFGLEEIIKESNVSPEIAGALLRVPQLFGSIDILDEAASLTNNTSAKEAVEHLRKLYEVLKLHGVEKYVTFDLGMLDKLRYYTGIVFQAFTYGTGEYIASGGRYDNLIGQFGTAKPSIGFSITVDYLLIALDRQKIALDIDDKKSFMVLFTPECRENAIKLAKRYRTEDVNVNLILKDASKDDTFYVDYAKNNSINTVIKIYNDAEFEVIQTATGSITREKLPHMSE